MFSLLSKLLKYILLFSTLFFLNSCVSIPSSYLQNAKKIGVVSNISSTSIKSTQYAGNYVSTRKGSAGLSLNTRNINVNQSVRLLKKAGFSAFSLQKKWNRHVNKKDIDGFLSSVKNQYDIIVIFDDFSPGEGISATYIKLGEPIIGLTKNYGVTANTDLACIGYDGKLGKQIGNSYHTQLGTHLFNVKIGRKEVGEVIWGNGFARKLDTIQKTKLNNDISQKLKKSTHKCLKSLKLISN